VLAQGSFVALLGIGAGLAATPPMLKLFSRLLEQEVGGAWELKLSWGITWFAVAVALATSLLASGLPAWRSGRLRIVDELRKVV
jgi:ABC-type antimicrobial peptide transport system permease subunit